jgi:hypothetical protein
VRVVLLTVDDDHCEWFLSFFFFLFSFFLFSFLFVSSFIHAHTQPVTRNVGACHSNDAHDISTLQQSLLPSDARVINQTLIQCIYGTAVFGKILSAQPRCQMDSPREVGSDSNVRKPTPFVYLQCLTKKIWRILLKSISRPTNMLQVTSLDSGVQNGFKRMNLKKEIKLKTI